LIKDNNLDKAEGEATPNFGFKFGFGMKTTALSLSLFRSFWKPFSGRHCCTTQPVIEARSDGECFSPSLSWHLDLENAGGIREAESRLGAVYHSDHISPAAGPQKAVVDVSGWQCVGQRRLQLQISSMID
jgi:hypothetical protein